MLSKRTLTFVVLAVFVGIALLAISQSSPRPVQYKVVLVDDSSQILERTLNEYASQGWEYAGMDHLQTNQRNLIFKKAQ